MVMNYRSLTLTTHLDNDNASTSLDGNELSSSSSSSFYGGIGNIERVDEYLDDNSLGGRDFEFRNGGTLAITEADEGDEEVEDLHKIEKCLPFDDDATPGATGRCPTTLPIVPGGGHIDDFPSLHGVARMKSILKKMDLSCSSGSGHSTESSTSSVSFRSVEVREYDRTVGDNPSCGSGPPLSLDWGYSEEYEGSLDEYELLRSNERSSHWSNLRVCKHRRRNILAYQWGHSMEELEEARRSTRKMQRQRSMTRMLLPVHLAEEVLLGMKNFAIKKKKNTQAVIWSD
ncbi:hypothetical protein ACHAXA_007363 [Cyclostephanos tholiformis]|uniref:Uncharacterized protein n=1 Tax=Cyclostephanos tholiformis TaxID=382380 RepID=A0ABD3RW53_9STRA